MTVMIGVDPHKGSHTAVAIDRAEVELAAIQVRSSSRQVEELLAWAGELGDRIWAVECAGGVGYLVAQQLVAAGDRVLDVPATLAARARLLGSGRSSKNDPNDAYSVAVASLRAPALPAVAPADNAAVLRLLAKRNKQLGSQRTRTACRLHALLVELVPGGISREITVNRAARLLESFTPTTPVEVTRHELAAEHLDDLRRLDDQLGALHKRMDDAVKASRTTVRELFGFGPVVSALAIGHTRDVRRFASRDRFAAYNGTAPIEVSSGGRLTHRLSRRGNRQLNHAIHMAAITQIRHRHSPGYAYYQRKLAEGKTSKEAIRALKRRISDALYERLVADAKRHAGPGGQAGATAEADAAGLEPRQPALQVSHSRTRTERRGRHANTRTTQAVRSHKPARTRI
ncbi:MAG: IS110 family transposase [Aldersonia sp.]|nr:IS110 family transposase [Aldersonia sp.]